MCMFVCIKLHITAQSGPVILVILCHLQRSSQGGINDTYYENLSSDATKGTLSLYLYSSYLSPECLVLPLPSLLPFYSLYSIIDYLGRQLLNQPFLVCIVFIFPPKCLPFPTSRLQLLWGFRRFFPSPPPSPIPSSCVCVCVCVFIKLHITAQSGLVILVILCHSH